MDVITIIVSLTSGAVGGNMAGSALKEQSLGKVGNLIVGIVGGAAGAFVLQPLGASASGDELNAGALIANIASGAVGGGLLMMVVGFIKGVMTRAHGTRRKIRGDI